ncbi:MAG TPA: hypothetical protein VNK51_05530 [Bradyrhizobium sp.]|nr:hypothetical protein [Bradyrhizobium sp.]
MATRKEASGAAARKSADSTDQANKEAKEAMDAAPVIGGIQGLHKRNPEAPFSTVQLVGPQAAPPSQMVKVKELKTGRVFAAWPVDARELVTHPNQEHVYAKAEDEMTNRAGQTLMGVGTPAVAPKDSTAPVGVDPVPAEPAPRAWAPDAASTKAQLEDKSKSDLQDLAKRSGVNPDQPKAQLVEQLQSHVTAGTVMLGGPKTLSGAAPNTSPKVGA